ncbi:MAG: hypothetical protein CMB45_05590 [Euryarchaeota archaeon]|nr:hypothetical protein [Euryarchaeota archaeon]MBK38447.1 hypothetical protein [Euryarchaeota archaeon]
MTFSLDDCVYVSKGFATINWETEAVYVVNIDTSAYQLIQSTTDIEMYDADSTGYAVAASYLTG